MSEYILSCCSTADLSKEHFEKRNIRYICFHYTLGGTSYPDDLGQSVPFQEFYARMAAGEETKTSQVNVDEFLAYFEPMLQEGRDVLHVSLSSGLSGSVNSARIAAEELREKYPERKLYIVDSLGASSGYGLLVDEAADLRDEGKSLEEVAQWVLANRNRVHHQFFSSDMTQFRRTGRVSGAAAMVATVLNICPIMRLNDEGRIIAYDKVRGKKKAVAVTVENMLQHAQNGADYASRCYVCHSNCREDAELLMAAIEEKFPHLRGKILLCDIGTIIGSHAGKGTVAVFFLGDERPHME